MKYNDSIYCKLCDKKMVQHERLSTHLFKYHINVLDQYFEIRPFNWKPKKQEKDKEER